MPQEPEKNTRPAHIGVKGYYSMCAGDCPGCADWARRMNEHAALATSRSQNEGAE